MSDIQPTFSGEVLFRRYSDTSTQGASIVLQLEDREALRPFIGLEGKRFACVLVAIGDDEELAPPPKPRKMKAGPICEWLALRCKESPFQEWVGQRSGLGAAIGEPRVAEWCRGVCEVQSRADIDGNPNAERLFEQHIRRPWLVYQKAPARQSHGATA